jgi:hypothetical protein
MFAQYGRWLVWGLFVVALIVIWSLAGCVSTTTLGAKIQKAQISEIKKGVTTRADIERMFGAPLNVSIIGDGRRMMFYSHTEVSNQPTAAAFVPYAGLFTSTVTGQHRTQMLQIVLNKESIVEDFELTDTTNRIDANERQMTLMPTTPTKN